MVNIILTDFVNLILFIIYFFKCFYLKFNFGNYFNLNLFVSNLHLKFNYLIISILF